MYFFTFDDLSLDTNNAVLTELINLATEICQDLNSAQPAQVAAASSYIASAVASESASTASGNMAVRTDAPVAGVGILGAGAALALLAL